MGNQEIVNFIMTEINKYKNGDITKETFYDVIEGFISNTYIEYSGNETLKYVLEHLIPDACTFYIDAPGGIIRYLSNKTNSCNCSNGCSA